MTRADLIRIALLDYGKGDPHTLVGLIDWLHFKGYNTRRIIRVATEQLKIPIQTVLKTLDDLYGLYPFRIV